MERTTGRKCEEEYRRRETGREGGSCGGGEMQAEEDEADVAEDST